MKVQIPTSVQELIKCSNCNALLSCGPIYLVHDTSEAICGRCSPQNPKSITSNGIRNRTRNIQYEATAKLLSFPCSFAAQGCTQQLDFSSDKPNEHELTCEFRTFICPIRHYCNWMDRSCNLIEHCRKAHPLNFLENDSFVPRPDLTKSHLINYLITAYNIMFLLHFKVCAATGKLFYTIRLIQDSGLLGNFIYYLEIEGNNKNLIEHGSIHSRGILMLQETSICISINSLLHYLGGKYNETKFTIRIRALSKCAHCLKTFDNVFNSIFCHECQGNLIKCKFHVIGCGFVDFIKSKCEKHEDFFCKYVTTCWLCKGNFIAGSFIEHLQSSTSCFKTIKSNLDSVVRLSKTENWDFIIFTSNNIGTIICNYHLFNSILSLSLYSSLQWHELKNFECSIELTDPQTKHTKLLTPKIGHYITYDWHIRQKMNNFPSWQDIGLDLKLTIK